MAIQYIDTSAAADGSGAENSPFNTINGKTLTGNTTYLKRGTFVPVTSNKFCGTGAIIDCYGDPGQPLPIVYPTTSMSYVFYVQGNNVEFRNIIVDAKYTATRCIAWIANTGNYSGGGATNCTLKNASGYNLYILTDTGNTYTVSNLTFTNCVSMSANGHGVLVAGNASSITFDNCVSANNSLTAAEHGFSCLSNRTSVTSGWTNTSGNIYSRAETYTTLGVTTNDSTYPNLTKNTSTPTTPAAGEWGSSAGSLYINIATNPNTSKTVTYCWAFPTAITFNNCWSYGTLSSDSIEGTGIQLDDFTSDSTIKGCLVEDNVGAGITFNMGSGNSAYGNILRRNGRYGISVQKSKNAMIFNNTSYDNNTIQVASYDITIDSQSTGATISNNIVKTTKTNGIFVGTNSASGSTAANNCVYGNTGTAVSGVTDSGVMSIDPILDPRGRPTNARLFNGGATVSGTDFYGNTFPASPSIGAIQCVGVYPRGNLTTYQTNGNKISIIGRGRR